MTTTDGFTSRPPPPPPKPLTPTDILIAGLLGIPPDTLLIQRTEDHAGKPDPRDPHPTRDGIFRHHNCWKCNSGAKPCVVGNPRQCEFPATRND